MQERTGMLASGNSYRIDTEALRIVTPAGDVLADISLSDIKRIRRHGEVLTVTRQCGESFHLNARSEEDAMHIASAIGPHSDVGERLFPPSRKLLIWGCAGGGGLLLIVSLAVCVLVGASLLGNENEPEGADAAEGGLDPLTVELAQHVLGIAVSAQDGFIYPEDVLTFGLLMYHLESGSPPPLTAVDIVLEEAMRTENIASYRVRGFRSFWYGHIVQTDWERNPYTANSVVSQFNTYLIMKSTARQNAINQQLNAIVGSEEAWRNAMEGWKAHETQIRTREEISQAEQDAFQTMLESDAAIKAAAEALGQPSTP